MIDQASEEKDTWDWGSWGCGIFCAVAFVMFIVMIFGIINPAMPPDNLAGPDLSKQPKTNWDYSYDAKYKDGTISIIIHDKKGFWYAKFFTKDGELFEARFDK